MFGREHNTNNRRYDTISRDDGTKVGNLERMVSIADTDNEWQRAWKQNEKLRTKCY